MNPDERLAAPSSASEIRSHETFITILIAVAITVLWLPHLNQSFWLDEAGTYWVTDGSFGNTVDRAARYQGQSPAYFVVAWLARALLGDGEVALRLPSVGAAVAAVFVLYRLGRRAFGREVGLLAALILAAHPLTAYAATDARPYAFALLALVLSALFLVRWNDRRRTLDAVIFVSATVITLYLHFLFAFAFIGHAIYAWRRRHTLGNGKILLAGAGVAVLMIPAAPQVFALSARRASLSLGYPDPLLGSFSFVTPSFLVATFVGATLIARRFDSISLRMVGHPHSIAYMIAWLVAVPAGLGLFSVVGDASVFADRYLVSGLPPLAILAGWAVNALEPSRVRRINALALVIVMIIAFGWNDLEPEGWREAAVDVNRISRGETTPVLFQGGFIESTQIEWLMDPERASYLMAPTAPYPITGRLIPLPFALSNTETTYFEGIIEPLIRNEDQIIVVMRYDFVPVAALLQGRLEHSGWTYEMIAQHGRIAVHEFLRT